MTNKEKALKIKTKADQLGWEINVRGSILTITKRFAPNGRGEFTEADVEYHSILGLLPQTRPGSIWGTDSSGVGAITAMRTGVFTMNKSGGDKHILKELAKLL